MGALEGLDTGVTQAPLAGSFAENTLWEKSRSRENHSGVGDENRLWLRGAVELGRQHRLEIHFKATPYRACCWDSSCVKRNAIIINIPPFLHLLCNHQKVLCVSAAG